MKIFPKIPEKNGIYSVYGLNNSLESIFLTKLIDNRNIYYFSSNPKKAKSKFDVVNKNFNGEISYLDDSFFDESISVAKLPLLAEIFTDFGGKKNRIVVLDIDNINRELTLLEKAINYKIDLKKTNLTQKKIIDKLLEFGFNKTEFISGFGDYAVRGSVIDIYSPNYKKPIRIQFFKEKIKSITPFNLETMKSESSGEESFIVYKYNQDDKKTKKNIIDLIPENSFIIFDKHFNAENRMIIESISKKNPIIFINPLIKIGERLYDFELEYLKLSKNNISGQINQINKKYSDFEITYLINSNQSKSKISDTGNNFFYDNHSESYLVRKTKNVFISLKDEFEEPSSKFDEFKKLTYKFKNFSELKLNDLLVHKKYGICIYDGLTQKNLNGSIVELVQCIFDHDDYLFVPITKIDLLQKYVGNKSGIKPDSLRDKTWGSKVKKAKKVAEKVAKEILSLYAKRKLTRGFSFKFNSEEIDMFEKDFEYNETPDQLKAIEDVYEDMKKDYPMDRLVCGDVGFGKTEIALRSAYIASMNSKQVAVIAPTTLLVNQHLNTFIKRFKNFPINIQSVSRNTPQKDLKRIIQDLADSKIDILIGTHKLLNEQFVFKNLGLVVIDEEHKFGVRHKEKIKEIRMGVDYLALSATPIPRTLQLSLSGIKDISIIATPPVDRFSIDTQVHHNNKNIIKNAINFELDRKGRVFFIHNEIKTIESVSKDLRKMFPSESIEYIHGKMNPNVIERIILDFIDGKISILVTTTLIESGIDIQEANTIIINNANKFGLSDLYQIRGRIGRGNQKGYAYLILEKDKNLNENALKRLSAIQSLSSLGSGFNLAMEDLEIRGAGNLFGTDQSGNVYDVGIEFYLELLDSEIKKINNSLINDEINIEINSKDKISIPDQYISSAEKRIYYYKRISCIDNKNEATEVIEELIDLFGIIPEEVNNLIKLSELKVKLKELKIYDFKLNQTNMIFKNNYEGKLKNFEIFINKYDGKIDTAKRIFDRLKNVEKFIEKFSKFENNKFIINCEDLR